MKTAGKNVVLMPKILNFRNSVAFATTKTTVQKEVMILPHRRRALPTHHEHGNNWMKLNPVTNKFYFMFIHVNAINMMNVGKTTTIGRPLIGVLFLHKLSIERAKLSECVFFFLAILIIKSVQCWAVDFWYFHHFINRVQSEKPGDRSWTSTSNLSVTPEKEARKLANSFRVFLSVL